MVRAFIISVAFCILFADGLSAQIKLVSRARLDSLSAPVLCEDANKRIVMTQIGDSLVVMDEDEGVRQIGFCVKNISDKDFSIVRVTTTCSCLSPVNLPLVVRAGGESMLKMAYNPKGHPGTFERRMFVYSDFSGNSPVAVKVVKAKVNPGMDDGSQGLRIGPLLFKDTSLSFKSGKDGIMKLVVRNVGLDDVEFGFNVNMLPEGLTVKPAEIFLGRGEEKAVDVIYTSSLDKRKDLKNRTVLLMVTGLGQLPRHSVIKINIE